MSTEAYIFDAVRTPRGRGKKDGSLHTVKPINLVVQLLHALQQRNDLDTAQVEDIVLGCVTAVADQGMNIAKVAPILADWSQKVAGVTLNRFCASGLEAVNLAAMKIRSGWEQLVVAGGVESMSRVPLGSDGGAWSLDPATNLATGFVPQGIGADLIATLNHFSREDVDTFALGSQQKAHHASSQGYFKSSIVPVSDQNGCVILEQDETIRGATDLSQLATLKPAFAMMGEMGFNHVVRTKYPQVAHIEHVHTAGNSSGIVDGAALLLIGSEQAGNQLGLTPRARIVATAVIGSEPTIMLTAPPVVTQKVLKRAGMFVTDIDLFEVNEAFASVVLHFQHTLKIPADKINVNGGAIAMGHPLGATGAILVNTVLDELERRQLRYGLCTLCAGGGMGIATIIERI